MISNRYVIAFLYGFLRWLDRVVPIDCEKQIACYPDDNGLPRQYEDHDSSKQFFFLRIFSSLSNLTKLILEYLGMVFVELKGTRTSSRSLSELKVHMPCAKIVFMRKNRVDDENFRPRLLWILSSIEVTIFFFPRRSTGPKTPRKYSLVRHSILK